LLDTWQRSGLPAADFGEMVGVSKFTLYAWKARFDESGPEGLIDQRRGGPRGSKLAEITKRTILLLKKSHPEYGCRRISDMLLRGPALPASESAVARVLHEAGYQLSEEVTEPHPDKVRSFERAKPNQLWQTDLFTFILKRQNRRVYLVAFMDDHSRFIVSYGLHASQSSALVLEVLRAGVASYGAPAEILTDNGSQYVTWRGRSAFSKELQKLGIAHVVAKPRRPQTLGKVERFWGTLWRECLANAVFIDMDEARKRIGLFVDHYNFQRPHQGIEGLVPADRFFGAAPEVLKTLNKRVAANALELARHGVPKPPFYMTGQVGGKPFAVHAEGEKVIMTSPGNERQEVQLTPPEGSTGLADQQVQLTGEPVPPVELPEPIAPQGIVPWQLPSEEDGEEPAPGTSAIDELDKRMARLSSMVGPGEEPDQPVDGPSDVGDTIEEGGEL
jgi:transposase InsO family protein